MDFAIGLAFAIYLSIIFVIGYMAYRRNKSSSDFILGSRSTGYWVTAISAQASDMSAWLFMGFPAAIYATGTLEIWTAISLTFFMYLNWKLVAPRIRILTEKCDAITLSTFFEKYFGDKKGLLRITSALFCLYFFIFYIATNLITLGRLFESALNLPYSVGICIGVLVVFYVLLGGFLSVSWIDFFQGLFLLVTIIFVPLYALYIFSTTAASSTFLTGIQNYAATKNISLGLFPQCTKHDLMTVLAAVVWGLGYFGQPHILTKFMGIRDVKIVKKAQVVGLSWQIISLCAAILVGLVGMLYFPAGLSEPENIFITLVQQILPPFIVGIVLCAILAAAINVMGAQVLVSASVLSEDLFKPLLKNISDKKLLFISRVSVLGICLISLSIAYFNQHLVLYKLIFYAWTGLGCTFGPLMLATMCGLRTNARGAFYCILNGGAIAAVWPLFGTTIPAMLPGFIAGFAAMLLVSKKSNPILGE